MKAPYTVRFTVVGRGEFPFDMLRYASAWPASSEDATRLTGRILRRSIDLVTDRGELPGIVSALVERRFQSYGWEVTQMQEGA